MYVIILFLDYGATEAHMEKVDYYASVASEC